VAAQDDPPAGDADAQPRDDQPPQLRVVAEPRVEGGPDRGVGDGHGLASCAHHPQEPSRAPLGRGERRLKVA
jgi:hypothetical protein